MSNKNRWKNFGAAAMERRLSFFVVGCSVAVIWFLLIQSVFLTTQDNNILDHSYSRGFYTADCPWLHLAAFAAVCLVLYGSTRLRRPARVEKTLKCGSFALCGLSFGMLAWMVAGFSMQPSMDSYNVFTAAQELLAGDTTMFAHGVYMDRYPNQRGLLLYDMIGIRLFGAERAALTLQLLNVVWFAAAVYLLARAAGLLFDTRRWYLYLPAYAWFWPMGLYVTFIYGTLPGLALSAAEIWFLARYLKNPRRRYCLAAGAAGAAAALIKQNYLIVSVAVMLYFLWEMWRKRSLRPLLMVVSFALCSACLGAAVEQIAYTPHGLRISEGKPTIAWVAIGLGDEESNEGWFNHVESEKVEAIYTASGSEAAAAYCRDYLRKRLAVFAADPAYTFRFFARKITSEWNVPTFQSIQINRNHTISTESPDFFIRLISQNSGLNAAYCFAANLGLTQLWIWCLIYFMLCGKNGRPEHLLFCVIFLGGFLFHLAWEAKAQYTVVYVFLLLPYALRGMQMFRCKVAAEHLKQGGRAPGSRLLPCAILASLLICGVSGMYFSQDRKEAQAQTEAYRAWLSTQISELPSGCYKIVSADTGGTLRVDTAQEGAHAYLTGDLSDSFAFTMYSLYDRLLLDNVPQNKSYAIAPADSEKGLVLGMNSYGEQSFAGLKAPDYYEWTQQWMLCPEEEGVYTICILQTDKKQLALTVEADGKTVALHPYTGAENQKWKLEASA